jgi:hypothetical protein
MFCGSRFSLANSPWSLSTHSTGRSVLYNFCKSQLHETPDLVALICTYDSWSLESRGFGRFQKTSKSSRLWPIQDPHSYVQWRPTTVWSTSCRSSWLFQLPISISTQFLRPAIHQIGAYLSLPSTAKSSHPYVHTWHGRPRLSRPSNTSESLMSADAQEGKSSERSVFCVLGGIPAAMVTRLIFLSDLAIALVECRISLIRSSLLLKKL